MTDVVVTSLADLGSISTTYRLVRPDGQVRLVPLRSLSENEMWTLRQSVVWPVAPKTEFAKRVSDQQVVAVPNETDTGYLKARDLANRTFNYRLLLKSLEIEIPGATDEEKITAMQASIGNWAVKQLIAHVLKTSGIEEAEVAAAAEAFHGTGTSDTAGVSAARLDA